MKSSVRIEARAIENAQPPSRQRPLVTAWQNGDARSASSPLSATMWPTPDPAAARTTF
jgi:hypothetical protein